MQVSKDLSKDLSGAVNKVTSDPQVLQETKVVGKKIDDILSPTSLTIRKAETTETNSELAKIVDELTKNSPFLKSAEELAKKILADSKFDFSDVPDLVHFVVSSYNNLDSKLFVSKSDLPEFVRLVFQFVVVKFNLLTKDQLGQYEGVVVSSVKLVLLTPDLGKEVQSVSGLLNKFVGLFSLCVPKKA
jgi:hypothetical protein